MRNHHIGMVLAMLLFAACSRQASTPQPVADIDLWQDELPIHGPWLRDHLPDDSLIYLRLPDLIGSVTMPKGNALDPALRSTANVESVIAIQRGVVDNVLPHIPTFSDPAIRAWQSHLRSPVEVSAVFIPAPAALVAATTDLDSEEALNALLEDLGLGLAEPLDDDNTAAVVGAPAPVILQFDAASGRLLINAGPGVSRESFAKVVASLERDDPHPMRKLESRIDESGQGGFFWMDPREAIPLLQMSVPREQFNRFIEMGLDRATGLAFGWGVAGGKGRLALLADVPGEEERGLVPYVANDVRATSVGDPDALMILSIPSIEEFTRLEGLVLESLPQDAQNEWKSTKNDMQRSTGISIEEIFTAIGPEVVLILDRAGDYVAVRVRDAGLWNSIVERIAANDGATLDSRDIDGNTYYHLDIASAPPEDDDGVPAWLRDLDVRSRDHLYWTRDGDYLYLASVPQILFDRAVLGADTDVGAWMKTRQGIDPRHAFLSINGSSFKLSRRLYAIYIELLQYAADVAEVDYDIWSMPSAEQAGLPMRGTIGFTVDFGNPTLAAEMTFENGPVELVGSFTGVMAVGVIAAIAIPAYQDYTTRAQVAMGLNLASSAKAGITEHYLANGAFPGTQEAEAFMVGPGTVDYVQLLSVEPFTGAIIIDYELGVAGTGGQLYLRPTVDTAGHVTWSCSGTFMAKHLPASCRN